MSRRAPSPFDPEQTVDTGKVSLIAPEPPSFDPELEAALASLHGDLSDGRARVASGTAPPPLGSPAPGADDPD